MHRPYALIIAFCFIQAFTSPVQAATFNIPDGDTAALIDALDAAALQTSQAHVINLFPDSTYILTEIDNSQDLMDAVAQEMLGGGDQGLPMIRGNVTVNGNGAVIERAEDAPEFRFFLINRGGRLTLNNVTLRNGRATNVEFTRGDQGGAVFCLGRLFLNDSILVENYTSGTGGAISMWEGEVTLTRSSLLRNSTLGTGGAIFVIGNLSITDSTIAENVVGVDDPNFWGGMGGGIGVFTGNITIASSAIINNIAQGHEQTALGGGIYTVAGEGDEAIEISNNSTISGNRAAAGGGIYNASAVTIGLRNVTIADNIATREDGGGAIHGFTQTTIATVSNAILTDNSPSNCSGSVLYDSLGNNIDSDGSCAFDRSTDLSDIDPLIGELAENGGPTVTHALLTGSPAINAGNTSKCPLRDQRGIRRDSRCDIGAYEAGTAPALVAPAAGATLTNNRPTLSWNANGAARYQILLDTVNPPAFASGVSTSRLYTPPGPLLPRTYYWCVRSVNEIGQTSDCSEIRSFVVNPSANAAPIPDEQMAQFAELSWGRVSWATAYQVQIDNSPNFNNPEFDTVINTPTTHTVVTPTLPNGVWYWRVRAKTALGQWGRWSQTGIFAVNQ